MGDPATFVTFRPAGSTRREMLSPVQWPGTPGWVGSPGGRKGPIQLRPCAGGSTIPSREEPNDRLEATSPSRSMALADDGTKEPRWPGGLWWDGRPSGTPVLRGLDGRLPAEAYSPGGWRSRPFKLPSPSEQEGRYLPDGQGCRREYHLYGAPLPRPANGRQRLPYTLQVGRELARVRGAPDAIG